MTTTDYERYLGAIVATMNDGLLMVGPDGRIIMVNQAMERLCGYPREELYGRPCTILKCDACKLARAGAQAGEGTGRASWCELFMTGRETRKQCVLMRKDGTLVHVLKNAAILRDGDRVLGSVETLTDVTEVVERDRRIEELSRLLDDQESFHGMIGSSAPMRRTFQIIEKASRSDSPVLILGESGTGKELVARAIHELGPRREGPFIQLNCAALNESLLESELFGHIKGAFTGAYRHREGRFEAAHGGDIFLDEIGDVPMPIQVKLLRVLETKTIERVGENRPISVDTRVITATNRNLEELTRSGQFREDLLFRIKVIPIVLPPLRERPEDIPLLTAHFVRLNSARTGREVLGLTPCAMRLFMRHPWPGNVRELKSAIEYAFVIGGDGESPGLIGPEHLPDHIGQEASQACPEQVWRGAAQAGRRAGQGQAEEERQALLEALRDSGGNKSEAARRLGVNRVTVLNRMRKYGIDQRLVFDS